MSAPDRSSITKAVVPVAGLGTRLRPLTNITPKEMLPLGRKPTVEYIVEELHAAGIDDIIFVISPLRTKIREYFGDSACGGRVRLRYVEQTEQLGLAHAILQAEPLIEGGHFVVALGDSVIVTERDTPPIQRMIAAYKTNPAFAAITVEKVAIEHAHRYGMVKPISDVHADAFEIGGVIEKPKVEETPSEYAIGGRYIFDAAIFDVIRRTERGHGGELQITDSIALGIREGMRVWCAPLKNDERRYDMGNFVTYSEAFVAMCMLDDELRPAVRRAFEKA